MMHVRPATPEDIEWILDQAELFNQFIDTKHTMFPSRCRGRQKLAALIDQQPVFVSELHHPDIKGGQPTGFLIAMIHPNYWNDDLVQLTEMAWWVAPEYRATRAAALLLLAFEECGRRIGADMMSMSLEAKSPLNPDALEKRGYRLQERSFLRECTQAPLRRI